jgi:Flp pilus assembly protein TadD
VKPREPRARHDLAFSFLRNGRYDKSEQAFRAAALANPAYFGAYEDLGYLFYILGRYDEAIAEFERVAELAPDHGPTYNYLGGLYYRTERWDEAIAGFEKSFALEKSYDACANLGTLYYMKGRFADAARMYEWALEYKESDYLVIGNLAVAYYYIPEERDRATPLFEEAIELARVKLDEAPGNAQLNAVIAGYYSITHPDSAVYFAERALDLEPEDSEVLFRAAAVYEQIGERARALVLLGDALAKGYSLKVIENERQFLELREDPRYALLVAEVEESKEE